MARRARRLGRGGIVAAAVAGVAVVAAGAFAAASVANASTGHYRTASAAIGSVTQQLALTGSVESASRRDEAFQVAGTVAAVAVAVGDRVEAGAVLATLDTDSLQASVDSANDALAQAQQRLEDDLEAQSSGSSSTASSGSSDLGGGAPSGSTSGGDSGSAGGSSPGGSDPGGTGGAADPAVSAAIDAVAAAQQTLLDAVDAAETALTASADALVTAGTDCAPFLAAAIVDDGDGSHDGVSVADQLAAAQSALATCQTSTGAVAAAQQSTSDAQAAVEAAAETLDAKVADLQSALAASDGGTTATTSSFADASSSARIVTASIVTTAASGSSGQAGGSQSGGSSAPSAADILADRAAIAVAEAQVAIAENELASYQLTSTISGVVAQVAITPGTSVAADSDSAVITVLGDDGYLIDTTVSLGHIAALAAGQSATIVLPANGRSYTGSVAAVGVLDVSESSTPAFTVTIAVDAAGDSILEGAAAQIQVDVAAASEVLTVPLSAVHVDGAATTVDLLVDGEPAATPVEVGAVGTEVVEIASGIAEGDTVVLADLDAAIATDETESAGLTGLGGTSEVRGGGFSGGGFGGGTPGGGTPPGFGG